MGILVINEFGKGEREVPITWDQARIGRDPEGEIVLADIGVSRAHARILRREDALLVEDLGSRNGTMVNDRKIPSGESFVLRHGDTIRVGRSLLKVLLRLSRKIATRLGFTPGSSSGQETRGERPERPLCLFRLAKVEAGLLVAGEGGAAVRHALESDRVRIGRDASSDIVLDDPSVSADHAEIVYNREGFHLVDRDSTRGTFLDGVSVHVARLSNRGFIRFGKLKALFVVREEGIDPPEASFALRDHLASLFPERAAGIQEAFQECRFAGGDIAAELVLRGVLDPEEWWASHCAFRETTSKKPASWLKRALGHLRG